MSDRPKRVWPTPSMAIKFGACAVCLGGGETHDIVLDRLGPCSACGGSGDLDDMLANQCDNPECADHDHTNRTARYDRDRYVEGQDQSEAGASQP